MEFGISELLSNILPLKPIVVTPGLGGSVIDIVISELSSGMWSCSSRGGGAVLPK